MYIAQCDSTEQYIFNFEDGNKPFFIAVQTGSLSASAAFLIFQLNLRHPTKEMVSPVFDSIKHVLGLKILKFKFLSVSAKALNVGPIL